MRRTTIGLLACLIDTGLHFDLNAALRTAADAYAGKIEISDEIIQQIAHFIHQRLDAMLIESGCMYDSVQAATSVQFADPASAALAARSLDQHKQNPGWKELLAAYSRCVRITRYQNTKFDVDETRLIELEEKILLQAVKDAEKQSRITGNVDDFITIFTPLVKLITAFFDKVLVMADDQALKESRLGLLQRIAALAEGVADFSKLEGF